MRNIVTAGKSLSQANKVLIMIHGRGGTAEDILSLSSDLHVADFALLAPQVQGNSWYPTSFLSPREENEPFLSSSLNVLKEMVADLEAKGFSRSQIYLLGFSQGACLALEFAASDAKRYGGIVAFTGGIIGEHLDHRNYHGDFDGTPVFIGSSNPDFHVPVERVNETAVLFEEMGANVRKSSMKTWGTPLVRLK
ncbi:alpha/beta hydrolase [Pedobacter sp. NJ-S-72]